MADGWAYYDFDGEEVPPSSRRARFKCRTVMVPRSNLIPLRHPDWGHLEWRDVHEIDSPDERRNFKSRREMRAWFKERAVGKG